MYDEKTIFPCWYATLDGTKLKNYQWKIGEIDGTRRKKCVCIKLSDVITEEQSNLLQEMISLDFALKCINKYRTNKKEFEAWVQSNCLP